MPAGAAPCDLPQPLSLLPMILGLENDLLGFEKDHKKHNPMCAVQVLMREGRGIGEAYQRTLDLHNVLVREMAAEVQKALPGLDRQNRRYFNVALSWPAAMSEWMLNCPRYKV